MRPAGHTFDGPVPQTPLVVQQKTVATSADRPNSTGRKIALARLAVYVAGKLVPSEPRLPPSSAP